MSGRIEPSDTLRRLTSDGASAVASSSETVTKGGQISFSPTFNISGSDPREVAGHVRSEMRRFLARARVGAARLFERLMIAETSAPKSVNLMRARFEKLGPVTVGFLLRLGPLAKMQVAVRSLGQELRKPGIGHLFLPLFGPILNYHSAKLKPLKRSVFYCEPPFFEAIGPQERLPDSVRYQVSCAGKLQHQILD